MNRRRFVDLKGNFYLDELRDVNMHWSIDLLCGEYGSLGFSYSFDRWFFLNIRFRLYRFLAADRLILLIVILILDFFDLVIVILKIEVNFLGNVAHILIIDVGIIDICL